VRSAGVDQGLTLTKEDLHLQLRSRPKRRLVVFVIDTSDSMGDGPTARITAALGACLALATRAYLNRDQVCLITFRDREARLAVPPTASVTLVRQEMHHLPIGGATPLAAGLQKAREVIRQARIKHRGVTPLMVLISDGEATVPLEPGADPVDEALALATHMNREKIPALVIDTLEHQQRQSLMPRLARALGAECRHIHDLRSEQVLQIIEQSGPSQAS
jgi:Mg-chelatase subunit ChlD